MAVVVVAVAAAAAVVYFMIMIVVVLLLSVLVGVDISVCFSFKFENLKLFLSLIKNTVGSGYRARQLCFQSTVNGGTIEKDIIIDTCDCD
jgi:hypothetical protein